MTPYAGSFARFYDLFYAEKPYGEEVAAVTSWFDERHVQPPGSLLDVACGTGQHAIRFADSGWHVVGVDASTEMLEVGRGRAKAESVDFVHADMRTLDLGERRFDAAVCLFDSIGYAVTNGGVLSTLRSIRRHLRSDALFVVEFWHAAAMICKFERERQREWSVDGGRLIRRSRTSLDVPRQTATVQYSISWTPTNGPIEQWSETHENRYFLVQEMAQLLEAGGFTSLEFFPGFRSDGGIGPDTWHVVCLARADRTWAMP